ncbi:MAG: hypothetical protein U1E59_00910 [Amaricoccus sp.]
MRGVMENLAGSAAVVLALGTGGAWAAPYQAVSDGPDRVWVVDQGSGETSLCRTYAAPSPKVIDVFGGSGTVRVQAARTPEPSCAVVRRAGGYGSATPRQNYTGYSMYAPMSGISTGYYPGGVLPGGGYLSGGFPYTFRRWGDYGGSNVVVVRPGYVNINVD